jgi:hypothetical protein
LPILNFQPDRESLVHHSTIWVLSLVCAPACAATMGVAAGVHGTTIAVKHTKTDVAYKLADILLYLRAIETLRLRTTESFRSQRHKTARCDRLEQLKSDANQKNYRTQPQCIPVKKDCRLFEKRMQTRHT